MILLVLILLLTIIMLLIPCGMAFLDSRSDQVNWVLTITGGSLRPLILYTATDPTKKRY